MSITMQSSLTAIAAAAALALSSAAAQADVACGKPMSTAQQVQRLNDIHEIKNVASLHEYYHNALMHGEELRDVWAKRDDITWTNNTDKYIGQASMKRFYVDGLPKDTKGALWYHMLTTPVIEVSGDGKTAKGIWMSFGSVSGAMGNQAPSSQWTQEKYAMDFVKENGKWKIWHLRTYVDFYTPTDKSWLDPKHNLAAPHVQSADGAGVKEEPGVSFDNMKPDQRGEFYEGYHLGKVPKLEPLLPTSYCSFKDTFSY
jgi:SnoaL-like domain